MRMKRIVIPAVITVAAIAASPAPDTRASEEDADIQAGIIAAARAAILQRPEVSEGWSGADKITNVPIGKKVGTSVLDEYYNEHGGIAEDPELESVYRGEREVEPIDAGLKGACDDPVDIAKDILKGIEAENSYYLHELHIDKSEFEQIFWYAYPESRPITQITVDDVWFFQMANNRDGVNELLSNHGGEHLEFVGFSITEGRKDFTNFDLYQGVRIHALTEDAREIILEQARTFCNVNGKWKLYIYKD